MRLAVSKKSRLASYTLFILIGATLLCARKRHETIIVSATDQTVDAKITAYKVGWLWQADLEITQSGRMLLRTNLLEARDAIEDVKQEFRNISVKDGVVRISGDANHYRGPMTFEVPKR